MSGDLVNRDQRVLHDSVRVGPIGFGCWRFTGSSDEDNGRLIDTALDLGFNLVDTADVYGLDWGGTGFGSCEDALGRVLAANPSRRDRMVLATKGGIMPGIPYDSSSDYLTSACEASLRRLGVDHVDLYQIHRPDFFTHPDEVATAFRSLHERGLVASFGVSNFSVSQTRALMSRVDVPLVSTQPEFSCAQLSPVRDGTLDLCHEVGLVPLAWSALAGGRLISGDGVRAELIEVLDELAGREGVSRASVAVAFVLAHPSRPVALIGTQRVDRLHDLATATTVSLDRADVYRIIEASEGVPLP